MSTSLPNSDVDPDGDGQSVSTSDLDGYCYVIRMTPMERYNIEELKEFLTGMSSNSWILAVEEVPKLHYHIVLEHYEDLDEVKARIRKFLLDFWPDDSRKRGFGNAQYNCQISENKQAAISYALKDRGTYFFENYSQEYIDWCLEQSFPKKSPATFKVEYQKLCEQFQSSDMDMQSFMHQFVTLKAKYGQQVRVTDSYNYAISNMIRRDPDYASEVVDNFLNSR